MPYYLVDAVEDPDAGGLTADVPDGVGWCGNTDGTTYLVRTVDPVADATELFAAEDPASPAWQSGEAVEVDDRRVHAGVLYRCLQAHTTQTGWEPPNTAALWTVARADGDPWVEPTMAEDSYDTGDIVYLAEALWESQIEANTTEPGTDDRWWEQVASVSDEAAALISSGAAFSEHDPLGSWRVGGR